MHTVQLRCKLSKVRNANLHTSAHVLLQQLFAWCLAVFHPAWELWHVLVLERHDHAGQVFLDPAHSAWSCVYIRECPVAVLDRGLLVLFWHFRKGAEPKR